MGSVGNQVLKGIPLEGIDSIRSLPDAPPCGRL
jgi:hypothetical protein